MDIRLPRVPAGRDFVFERLWEFTEGWTWRVPLEDGARIEIQREREGDIGVNLAGFGHTVVSNRYDPSIPTNPRRITFVGWHYSLARDGSWVVQPLGAQAHIEVIPLSPTRCRVTLSGQDDAEKRLMQAAVFLAETYGPESPQDSPRAQSAGLAIRPKPGKRRRTKPNRRAELVALYSQKGDYPTFVAALQLEGVEGIDIPPRSTLMGWPEYKELLRADSKSDNKPDD